MKRSNLAFFNEIATHLSGARNHRIEKGFHSLNRNLGNHLLCPRLSRGKFVSFEQILLVEGGSDGEHRFYQQ